MQPQPELIVTCADYKNSGERCPKAATTVREIRSNLTYLCGLHARMRIRAEEKEFRVDPIIYYTLATGRPFHIKSPFDPKGTGTYL